MKYLIITLIFAFAFPVFAKDYDTSLKQYVMYRIYVRDGGKTLQALANEKWKEPLTIDLNSFRCLGFPSAEGNGKEVGVCTFEAVDTGSGGDHLKLRFLLNVTSDIEHPNNSRHWELHVQEFIYF